MGMNDGKETDLPEEGQGEGLAGHIVWVVLEEACSHEPDGIQLSIFLLDCLQHCPLLSAWRYMLYVDTCKAIAYSSLHDCHLQLDAAALLATATIHARLARSGRKCHDNVEKH